ncbi:MAG: hypothetical protein LBJ47_00235 [Tannerella sp.]|nr:hypothetical protein [Tannerella sp.]
MVMSIAFPRHYILPLPVIASVAKQSRRRRRPGLLHCVRNDGEGGSPQMTEKYNTQKYPA